MKWTASVSLILCLAACRRESPTIEKAPTPVRVSTVETFTPRSGERYSATILPNRQVQLAFRVAGFVTSVYQVPGTDGRPRNLEPGDVVPAGAVLAQVRERDYDLQVEQVSGQLNEARHSETTAKAQLAQAQAAAAKAGLDFERARSLYENKSLTKTDYDAAKAQYDATRAQVEAAVSQIQAVAARVTTTEASLATAHLARADTSIAAPFDAAVVQRNIEIGSLVGAGTPAYALAETGSVKASFGVSDRAAVRLRPGSRVPLRLEALPDRAFSGVVDAVAAVADTTTRLFQVEMIIPNPNGLLRPGMVATVIVGGDQGQPVTVVPLRAIVRSADATSTFAVMVVEDRQARRRTVKLGETYGETIAVTGVAPGERVISAGATLIGDRETVEVIP